MEKLLGRNMGEVIGCVVGIALAVVAIVLTAMDLASQTNGLMIAMDIIMIISSAIQILAVAAGWIVALSAMATGGTRKSPKLILNPSVIADNRTQ